ncbi:hypothetical protein [Bdellovibrio sp. BCCA]
MTTLITLTKHGLQILFKSPILTVSSSSHSLNSFGGGTVIIIQRHDYSAD